jgi:thiamine biosynthesis lipoprotein
MSAVVNLPASGFVPTNALAGWFEREEAIMGTRIAVQLWSASAREAAHAIDAVMADMHRTDRLMSTYKPESQLSQVNAYAFERPVDVDPDIIEVLEHALEYSRLSDGAFDVTYASVGYLYDYRRRQHPSNAQIEAALQSVDYRQVEVDAKRCTVRFHRPGMRIDFGGIAKGWACDRGVAILRRLGIENGMVNAGGDTAFLGDRRGKPWIVGIQHPRNREAVVTRIPLADEAISTSGDYERYFDEGGTRYHHILVPGTGKSPHAVHSVTVIGPNATRTDGLTKTVFILGPKRGIEFIERLGDVEAVVIDAQGCVHASTGFSAPG